MPKVKGKEFPYTRKGKAAARAAKADPKGRGSSRAMKRGKKK
jgi:hypothetical protein|tara:strand:- start:148 stop:273 length:126 start_codon:yes stop_codon:yes gene_type:complete